MARTKKATKESSRKEQLISEIDEMMKDVRGRQDELNEIIRAEEEERDQSIKHFIEDMAEEIVEKRLFDLPEYEYFLHDFYDKDQRKKWIKEELQDNPNQIEHGVYIKGIYFDGDYNSSCEVDSKEDIDKVVLTFVLDIEQVRDKLEKHFG